MKAMEWHKIDTVIGFFFGMIGGFIKYMSAAFLLLDTGFLGRLFEAGVTAMVCGFLGVAGKHLYDVIRKKLFNKKW